MPFAFSATNLVRNPFGEPSPDERAALAVLDVDGYLELVREPGRVVQFLGDAGRGKSTHLRAIHARVEGAPFVYFGEGERFRRVPRAPLAFIDEAQRMHHWLMRAVFVPSRSFVIASHEDLSGRLERAGFLVRSVEVATTEPPRVGAILARRVEWARRGPGPIPTFSDGAVRALQVRFGDDLRAMEDHLYDVFQRLTDTRTLGADDVLGEKS